MSRGIDGKNLARFGDVKDQDGCPVFVLSTTLTAVASGSAQYIVRPAPFRMRVLDCWLLVHTTSTGAATCQLRSGTNAITDAMAAQTIDTPAGVTTIDETYITIEKGGDLNVLVGGANPASAHFYVLCCRI